jgi:hypothetical protein
MKAHVLKGSKQEIAEKVVELDGEIREAIVFVDEPPARSAAEDTFSEMEPFTVRQPYVDDSRDAVYRRMEDE